MTSEPVVLPKLHWRESPNRSGRGGSPVELVVLHETAGDYAGAVDWLCNPEAEASAHFVLREDGAEAAQLVRLGEKAWTQGYFNSRCVSIELANLTPKGYHSLRQLDVAARMAAWLCRHYRLPPRWARHGSGRGLTFHGDLGAAGSNHPYCGPDAKGWARFLAHVGDELRRGDFRPTWAKL